MPHSVTLLVGPAGQDAPITQAVTRIVAAAGAKIDYKPTVIAGAEVTADTLQAVRATGRALMPYVPVDRAAGDVPPIVTLRRELGVWGNLRPVESVPGLGGRHPDVDILVVRETTEDIYANLEHESIEGVYESFKVTTAAACERIARHAFELAVRRGRKKVTIVHKANIMKKSDGLFLRTGQRVAEEFAGIEVEDVIVDALCMKLVLQPERFDVVVCANLFGDIVADLCAGLVGGRPNSPSINVADEATIYTVGHGDPADVANTEDACPTSLLFSAIILLRDLDENDAADRMMQAVSSTLESGTKPTALGGQATTTAFADAVIARLT
jgi:isocitrate dehydrogenase (NAD+)